MKIRLLAATAVPIGSMLLAWSTAHGQGYPTRPVRIIAAEIGGAGDYVARVVAGGLTAAWDKQVIVDNRGAAGPQLAADAPADGYTLYTSGPAFWTAQLFRKVSYDAVKDFAPVITASIAPAVLVVNPSVPVHSVKELIAYAKAKPGELNYGSSGDGAPTHLSAELFKMMAAVDIVRINYKGVALAANDTLSGRIQLMFPAPTSATPHIKSGKLRALAVTTAKPSPLFPGLPTIAASGLPGYESVTTIGVFAPAKTPAALVNRIARDIDVFLKTSEARDRLFVSGMEPVGGAPQTLGTTIKSEIVKWRKVVKLSPTDSK